MKEEELTKKFLNQYIYEGSEITERLESQLISLEKGFNRDIINSVFRDFHTLKGNSYMIGFNNIGDFTHSLENLLDKLRGNIIDLSGEMLDFLFQSLDIIKELLNNVDKEAEFIPKKLIEKVNNFLLGKQDKPVTERKNSEAKEVPDHKKIEISTEEVNKFIQMAVEKQQYLEYIVLDYNRYPDLTLSDIVHFKNSIRGFILFEKFLYDKLPDFENQEKGSNFFYTILFLTAQDPEAIFKEKLIRPIYQKRLYSPENTNEIETKLDNEKIQSPVFLKVDNNLLDIINNLSSETIIARNQLVESLSIEEDSEEELRLTRLSSLITSLHNQIKKVRLQQLESTFGKIHRVIRDSSRVLDKKIKVHFSGGDVELDKSIINSISESMIHIIKNSVDHGIEPTEERLRLGKPESGNLYLKASLKSGNVQIQIKDDGRGLSLQKIKEKVLEKKLLTTEQISEMTDSEIEKLIFLPGFSTAANINEISGRGVGMDVVQTNFNKLGGSVSIKNEEGKGLAIIATIPQNVTVFSSLIIAAKNMKLAIYQKDILEIIDIDSDYYYESGEHKFYKLRDSTIPLVNVSTLLLLEENNISPKYIAIIQAEDYLFGILFDELIGIEEIVIKTLGEHLKKINLYDGVAVLGDGKLILVLNVFAIAEHSKIHYTIENFNLNEEETVKEDNKFSQFVFRASGQQFTISLSVIYTVIKMLPEDIQSIGNNKVMKFENKVIPLVELKTFYSQKNIEFKEEFIYTIIVIYQEITFGIIAHEIVDITQSLEIFQSDNRLAEFSLGYAYINEKLTILIDSEKLFSRILKYIEDNMSKMEFASV